MSIFVLVRKDGAVLCRLPRVPFGPIPNVFWSTASGDVNHRYAVPWPSADAAARGAVMYDAEVREVETA